MSDLGIIKFDSGTVTEAGQKQRYNMPTERPGSFTLLNWSSLAVFGSYSNPPSGPTDGTWYCPPWSMLVKNFNSQSLGFTFDPNGQLIYSQATGAQFNENFELTVFDGPQAPGVFPLATGRSRSVQQQAGTAWGGTNTATTETFTLWAPQGPDRILIIDNETNQSVTEIGIQGRIYVPGTGFTAWAGLYDVTTTLAASTAVSVGHDQSDSVGSGAVDQFQFTLTYGTAPTSGKVTVTGAAQGAGS